jgi:ATP-dependent DNA ligase
MNYTGPQSRMALSRASNLGRNWVLERKVDGCYVEVHTDDRGAIVRLVSRTGREYSDDNARAMLGCVIMPGRSVLCGELEAHTEAGLAAAANRGYPLVHLFDALELDGQSLATLPFAARDAALWRAWTDNAERQGPDRPWYEDHRGRPHSHETGAYCSRIPIGWRRAPILETYAMSRLDELWETVVLPGEAEGLVAIDKTAPVGPTRAKRKIKPHDTMDCIVLEVLEKKLRLRSFRGEFLCQWSGRKLRRGQVVAVRHDGFYADERTPKFPRVDRARLDLTA